VLNCVHARRRRRKLQQIHQTCVNKKLYRTDKHQNAVAHLTPAALITKRIWKFLKHEHKKYYEMTKFEKDFGTLFSAQHQCFCKTTQMVPLHL
jgi:5-bromo-4-chloroindolyl phosphate hydrolysis protein